MSGCRTNRRSITVQPSAVAESPLATGSIGLIALPNFSSTALRAASCSGVRVVTQRISDADATR